MSTVSGYTSATIPGDDTRMDESSGCSVGQEKKLCCEHGPAMRSLYGESFETTAAKSGSTAPHSETNRRTKAQTSFARRTALLTASGLVKGIIPMSMRRRSDQQILATVGGLIILDKPPAPTTPKETP